MHDVVINEEQLRENYQQLQLFCRAVESRYRRYINLLQRLRVQGVQTGELAHSLSDFLDRARALQYQFDNLGSDFRELSSSYMRAIDEVDDL